MDDHIPTSSPSTAARPRIAVLWRGDPAAPNTPAPHEARLAPVIAALDRAGFAAEGVVWFDEAAAEIEAHLAAMAGVLVWINPLAQGRDRARVDATLRTLAARGVWISTHPDVTALMGTKEVLFTTRALGWGAPDTDLYTAAGQFDARFWPRLNDGPRVLKPLRGNDGQGVMKIARDGATLTVQHAHDDSVARLTQAQVAAQVHARLAQTPLIDQPFNPNAAAGMVRCYLAQDRVVGFAEQHPRQDGPHAFAMNSAKTMHDAGVDAFADLRSAMETDWVPALQKVLGLARERLPALWDADFLYRPPHEVPAYGRFMLCEINVSCVSPFPPGAPAAVAEAVTQSLRRR